MEVAELAGFDSRRAVGHEVLAAVVFREGDDVADRLGSGQEHDDAVETEGDAAVRRSTEAKGIEDVAEEIGLFLRGDTEGVEHVALEIAFVDSEAAAAEFDAVENDVVGDGAEGREVGAGGGELLDVVGMRAGEGVVDGVPLVIFGREGEEGELRNPKKIERGGVGDEVADLGHAEADSAQRFTGSVPLVGSEENEVAFLDCHGLGEGGFLGVAEEFDDGGLPFAAFDLDEGEALRAELLSDVGEVVDLAAGDVGEAFDVDRFHDPAVVEGAAENLELAGRKDGAEVLNLDSEAGVGFVTAEAIHRILVGEARERERDLDVVGGFDNGGEDLFAECEDVFFGDEGGFDVELSELGLAVGAEIFVAKTARDLEVALDAADHQELLVLLGSLRERVETAGGEARGHEEIAGSSGVLLDSTGVSISRKPSASMVSRMVFTTRWRRRRLRRISARRRSR